VYDPLDPFGIVSSCWEVQNAWLQHPRELSEELKKLGTEAAALASPPWLGGEEDMIPAASYDERFQDPIWTKSPYFDTLKEFYLLYTRWIEDAIYRTPGASEEAKYKAAFWMRQGLNALAPTNYFFTNPVALTRLMETAGKSVLDGWRNLTADSAQGVVSLVRDADFEVGETVATTPGAVVFRNALMELIQYAPATNKVHAMPIVIVAPWINKYYILDLNEKKSLIRFLVNQGFTVFVTSWKNVGPEMRDTTLDDYLVEGLQEAVNVARAICNARQVHLTGYCIGGTLSAAFMAWSKSGGGRAKPPVAHGTLLTTLVDFSDPGEIGVFIDENSVVWLEDHMNEVGYLDGKSMAASFRLLRSNSLLWHYVVHNYLLGETPPPFDVLYWNMDTTRLPAAMHSFYLREFYLNNKLVEKNGVTLAGRPIDLERIDTPLYLVGTEQDHITPWKETFKLARLSKGPTRYVLATSGHIMGVISPPVDPPKRRYWAGPVDGLCDAEAWREATEKVPGSWWLDWVDWLRPQCGALQAPPGLGNDAYPALAEAPGSYVLER